MTDLSRIGLPRRLRQYADNGYELLIPTPEDTRSIGEHWADENWGRPPGRPRRLDPPRETSNEAHLLLSAHHGRLESLPGADLVEDAFSHFGVPLKVGDGFGLPSLVGEVGLSVPVVDVGADGGLKDEAVAERELDSHGEGPGWYVDCRGGRARLIKREA